MEYSYTLFQLQVAALRRGDDGVRRAGGRGHFPGPERSRHGDRGGHQGMALAVQLDPRMTPLSLSY